DLVERDPKVADRVLQVQANVEDDLVVATARGVKVAACGADDLGQAPFDGRVDVFVGGEESEPVGEELLADLREPAEYLVPLFRRDDVLAGEHLTMRLAAAQVVRPEAAIEADRGGVFFGQATRRCGESPLPE